MKGLVDTLLATHRRLSARQRMASEQRHRHPSSPPVQSSAVVRSAIQRGEPSDATQKTKRRGVRTRRRGNRLPWLLLVASFAATFAATASAAVDDASSDALLHDASDPSRGHVSFDDSRDGATVVSPGANSLGVIRRPLAGLSAVAAVPPELSDAKNGGDVLKHDKHGKRWSKSKAKCEPLKVKKVKDRCEYVKSLPACRKDENLIHYLEIHYCALGQYPVVSAIFQAALIVIFCFILATVAEDFFCPALTNVAAALRLSEDVAGATLLSFGNGAPDVFAQIAAMTQASVEGVSLGVGAALGAAFFVSACVLPIAVLVAPQTRPSGEKNSERAFEEEGGMRLQRFDDVAHGSGRQHSLPRHELPRKPLGWLSSLNMRGGVVVERRPFARDTLFYLVAVVSIFTTLLSGNVTTLKASTLCGIYVLYVAAVVAPSRVAAPPVLGSSGNDSIEPADDTVAVYHEEGRRSMYSPLGGSDMDDDGSMEISALHTYVTEGVIDDERVPWTSRGEGDDDTARPFDESVWWPAYQMCATLRSTFRTPVMLILRTTMPLHIGGLHREIPDGETFTEENPLARQSRLFVSLIPMFSPLFFCFANRDLRPALTSSVTCFVVGCGGIIGSACIFLGWPTLTSPEAPRQLVKTVQGVLTAIAFVQSIVWMDLAAGELVGLFATVGRISGWSESLLGATVFAWGISVGDMVSDTTMSKKGCVLTAIAACFGGPLFNLLMGLSLGLLVATATKGAIEGVKLDNEIIVLAACQICFALYYVIAVPLVHGCRVSRGLAVCILSFYAVSQVLVILTSTKVIFHTPWM